MANQLSNAEILALTPEQRAFLGVKLRGQNPLGRPKFAGLLTPKQAKVAAYLLLNLTAGQIAEQMSIGKAGVRMHIGDIYRKLGVKTRGEAMASLRERYGTARNLAWQIQRENRGSAR